MELIDAGRCASIYTLDSGHVLKLYDERFTLAWVSDVARQTDEIVKTGVRAPEVHEVRSHGGLHGIVMERINGATMWQTLAADPDRAVELAEGLANLHLAIHAVDPPMLIDGVDRMRGFLTAAEGVEPSVITRALALVDDGAGEARVLAHGDLHPGNAMVTAEGEVVAIDWDFPLAAPAAFEMARSCYLAGTWALAPGTNPSVAPLRSRFEEAFLATYLDNTTVSGRDIERWRLPHVIGRRREGIAEESALLDDELDRLAAT